MSSETEIRLESSLIRLRIRHDMELKRVTLDPKKRSPEVREFEDGLRGRIVGQDEAVAQFVEIYQTLRASLSSPNRPVSNLLLLGPTGSGKTRIVEAAVEILLATETRLQSRLRGVPAQP
jgi:ATP-dependent Clp protease ATP-binding subunit ClpA